VQPYFVLQGNVCALLAAKDHVTLFLYDGGLAPDPDGIITGGHGNRTGRMIAIRQDEPINAPAMVELLRHIIADNRAGGWRKILTRTAESIAEESVSLIPHPAQLAEAVVPCDARRAVRVDLG
jgi:hypothetical protein